MKSYLLISFLLLAMGGCSDKGLTKPVDLDEEFTLKVGETASFGSGARLTMDSVVTDSRCPLDVDCVWEGNAEVRLSYLSPDHPPVRFILNTSGSMRTDTTIQSYSISLLALAPQRKSTVPVMQKEYIATLKVVRR